MTDLAGNLAADLALETRTGWPADLRILIERYPREVWKGHANLGEMAQFWLGRHGMFRELSAMLDGAGGKFREGMIKPRDYAAWFAPRLQFFLSQLHAHHHIEDHHYFPLLRTADRRLAAGFNVLEGDHDALHRNIADSIEAANALLRVLEGDADAVRRAETDAVRRAADAYDLAGGRLIKGLVRHLDDEEDLIVPLILDRGEAALGVKHGL